MSLPNRFPAPSILPPLVVDASVGVKWVVKEDNSTPALALLDRGHRLLAPDRFYSEIASVLWKRTRRSDPVERITPNQARGGLAFIQSLDIDIKTSMALASFSLEIALEIGHPTYDCDYLALALSEGAAFVTADARFYRKLSGHPTYGPLIRWVDPANSPLNGSLLHP